MIPVLTTKGQSNNGRNGCPLQLCWSQGIERLSVVKVTDIPEDVPQSNRDSNFPQADHKHQDEAPSLQVISSL